MDLIAALVPGFGDLRYNILENNLKHYQVFIICLCYGRLSRGMVYCSLLTLAKCMYNPNVLVLDCNSSSIFMALASWQLVTNC